MPRKTVRKSPVDLDFTLRRVFGKAAFKPLQREVILASLDKKDVFLQAATGFGKSLCFQVPAVIDHGITIVVSPLLALMKSQVDFLQTAGIEAATINSTTSQDERQRVLKDLACGHPKIKLLYVTPELCAMDHFQRRLRVVHSQRELSRIVIDEAHCISEWGHDFRPSFQQLGFFKREFPGVPLICLTATSTPKVQQDILNTLGLSSEAAQKNLLVFRTTTVRANLHYEVRFKSDEIDHFEDFLAWYQGVMHRYNEAVPSGPDKNTTKFCGIIYALTRRECEIIASRLSSHGIGAKAFHAGISNGDKDAILSGWMDKLAGHEIIVATTAFGMGIDKEDVRFVIHWQLPKSFEGFYQEAGRAGRDGRASRCIIYYSREDRERGLKLLLSGKDNPERANRVSSLKALIAYCESTSTCRHQEICDFFREENIVQCDYACDWHRDALGLKEAKKKCLISEDHISTPTEV